MTVARGISVVIPAFGRAEALRRAIDSVTSSAPAQSEIVVVDDASEPPLAPLLPERNAHGIAIRVIRQSRNRGAGVARAMGMRRARFDYVAFLDSDDTFTAGKLDQLEARIRAEAPDLIFHPAEGSEGYNWLMSLWARRLRLILPLHWLVALLNPIPTPTLAVRRRARLGHPTLRHAEDWAFLLRYVDAGTRVAFIPLPLARIARQIGTAGGLSGARKDMRQSEFAARRLLLRRPTPGNVARFAAGTVAGWARLVSDRLRPRKDIA